MVTRRKLGEFSKYININKIFQFNTDIKFRIKNLSDCHMNVIFGKLTSLPFPYPFHTHFKPLLHKHIQKIVKFDT